MFYLKLLILFNFGCLLIECIIPGQPKLSVIKLDQKLIERKRQDTLDMCRMFNEENDKEHKNVHLNGDSIGKTPNTKSENSKRRYFRPKRDVDSVLKENPALKEEDVERVEKIVDKIYDDMNEHVEYRRLNLTENAKTEEKQSGVTKDTNDTKSERRFNFAPETFVIIPPKEEESSLEVSTIKPSTNSPRFRKGIVPYFIDPKTYDSHLIESIMQTFSNFEKQTCIRLQRLRERPTDMQSLHNILWIYISNPSGIRQCVHSNDKAKIQGVQLIVFGYDCMSQGDILHELMHVLGFPHEHTRPDRDRYITVMWDNIKPGYRKYFETDKSTELAEFPYDYASVLHYPPRAFSRNGKVTIWTEAGIKIGQRERLSDTDLQKVDMLYSGECMDRNKDYLLSTCPSAVNSKPSPKQATIDEIKAYFRNRVWPYGIVNYQIRDSTEFSADELDNIRSVFRHIEHETCIEFRDMTRSNENNTLPEEHKLIVDDADLDAVDAGMYNKTDNDNLISNDENALPSGNPPEATRHTPPEQNFPFPPRALRYSVPWKIYDPKTPGIIAYHHEGAPIILLTKSSTPGCVCPPAGMPDGIKMLNLSTDCFNSVNDLLHVFVHVLGLDHQHNMHDRDSYIHILWDQFTDEISKEIKQKLPPAASAGFPYDYHSIMHSPWMQIKDGRTNIMYPIWNDGWAMGHWEGLSSIDVQKLELLYYDQCASRMRLPLLNRK